ncbi:MAG: hypothetical protein N2V77_00040 [Canidatus Methanoxibalbensis ujae]|nr:hypothetical protein [Candidatus Methanoxibalbensis ujae]
MQIMKYRVVLLIAAVITFSATAIATMSGSSVEPMSHSSDSTFNPSTVGADMTVNIALNVSNSGNDSITEVNLYEPYPYDNFDNLSYLTPPDGWTASKAVVGGQEYIKWESTNESQYNIPAGESLQFSFSVKTPASGGTYTWSVRTYDNAGGYFDDTVGLEVDATPPQIGNITPNKSAPVYTKYCEEIWVNFTTDSSAENNPYNITIYRDGDIANITSGTNITEDAAAHTDGRWSFLIHIDTNESCNYTVRVTVEDEYGNRNTSEETDAVIIDNEAPSVDITSPTESSPYILPVTEDNVSVSFDVSDNKPFALQFYNISVGSVWCNGTLPSQNTSMNVSCDISSLSEGWHDITVYVSDKSGNEASDTEVNAVLVDKTAPSQVTDLTVEYNETSGYIDLSWSAANDALSGVAYYRIYRNDTICSNLPGDLVAVVDASNTSWTDEAFLEDGQTYYYVVTAVDSAGNENTSITGENCGSATYTIRGYSISLTKGWNLISLPLIPENESIDSVLADCMDEIDSVHAYDARNGTWLTWRPYFGGTLTTMTTGKGYWIFMDDACTFRYRGYYLNPGALPPSYEVVEGWNLIGFHSLRTNVTPAQYLEGVRYTEPLYGYEDGRWILYCNGLYCDRNFMDIGKGYWVYVTQPGTIVPHEER